MPTSTAETTIRQVKGNADRMRGLVDGEPLHTDGAARHALRFRVEWPAQGGKHIRAGAPILADGKWQLRRPRLDMGGGGREQLVANHRKRDFARGPRRHRDGHAVARLIFGLVECDLEQIRRIGARFGIPA
jgi:hypothetical protein